MPQIRLQDVTKTYQVGDERIEAVRAVTLHVERGEFISIVGHSGSGKTTLLSMIGGITMPSTGKVVFEDTDIALLGADALAEYRASRIGFMFQFASLLPMLTVGENLLLPTVFAEGRDPQPGAGKKAKDLLRMVGLADKSDRYPAQLSGGQQRRVALARAFMNSPSLILADEPTGDLDEDTEQDMMNFFRTMNQAEDITFLMVTHNTDLAKQTKRMLRMNFGSLQEVDVLSQHPFPQKTAESQPRAV